MIIEHVSVRTCDKGEIGLQKSEIGLQKSDIGLQKSGELGAMRAAAFVAPQQGLRGVPAAVQEVAELPAPAAAPSAASTFAATATIAGAAVAVGGAFVMPHVPRLDLSKVANFQDSQGLDRLPSSRGQSDGIRNHVCVLHGRDHTSRLDG